MLIEKYFSTLKSGDPAFVVRMINELNAAGVGYRLEMDGIISYFTEADKERGEAIIALIEAEAARTADLIDKEGQE